MKLAAMDMGSNAIRFAVAQYSKKSRVHLVKKLRVPVRLGTEAFEHGEFSESTLHQVAQVFKRFKKHMNNENVDQYMAVATSACRDSKNTALMFEMIKEASGILVETISGDVEADILMNAIQSERGFLKDDLVLMDIGGGSTELTIIEKGKLKDRRSFDLGTVRLLGMYQSQNSSQVQKLLSDYKEVMLQFLLENVSTLNKIHLVGTGGNLRRLGKLRKHIFNKKDITVITLKEVHEIYHQLHDLSALQRMEKFNLKHDRAEVIIPAMDIFALVVEEIPFKKIELPNVGLIDGLFSMLHKKSTNKIQKFIPVSLTS